MKKLLIAMMVLCSAVGLCLTGCSSEKEPEVKTVAPPAQAPGGQPIQPVPNKGPELPPPPGFTGK